MGDGITFTASGETDGGLNITASFTHDGGTQDDESISIGTDRRAHVWTPVTQWSRMPSSAWKKKKT